MARAFDTQQSSKHWSCNGNFHRGLLVQAVDCVWRYVDDCTCRCGIWHTTFHCKTMRFVRMHTFSPIAQS